jgi:transcriptional regulator GlxA family with amidase domain
MRIEILVFEGFDEIDVFGPFEVLSSAGFEVELVALEPGNLHSMRGVRLHVAGTLARPEALVVPGGGWLNRAPEGAWTQVQRGVLPVALADVATSARWMASVCSGAMLLAAAGLLAGRYATTNRGAYDDLRPHVLEVVEERVVDDGDIITSGSLTSGLDLGLWITERELGSAVADRVARSLEYPRQGRVWHAPPRSA